MDYSVLILYCSPMKSVSPLIAYLSHCFLFFREQTNIFKILNSETRGVKLSNHCIIYNKYHLGPTLSLSQITCFMLFIRALISSSRVLILSSTFCLSSASSLCCSSFLNNCSRVFSYSIEALWCFSCSCFSRNLQ